MSLISPYYDRIAELRSQIDDVEGLIIYWLNVEDPDLLEEAPGRIAVLETDLASLKMEHNVLIHDNNKHP